MKVLFITQTFFPAYTGGTEAYLLNMALSLVQKGIDCSIICTNSDKEDSRYYYKDIPIQYIGNEFNIKDKIRQIVETGDINIIHVHSMGGRIDECLIESLAKLGISVFFTPHLTENFCLNGGKLKYKNKFDCNGNVDIVKCQTCISYLNKGLPFYFKNRFSQYVLQYIFPKSIATLLFSGYHFQAKKIKKRILYLQQKNINIITLSKWYGEILRINDFKNVTLISQGVNSIFLTKSDRHLNNRYFQWIFIGRLSSEKGIAELIDVFVHNSLKDDKLLLCVFHNDILNDFEKLIFENVKQFKNIIIYKNSTPKEISYFLNKSNCLVLASKVREMAPLVIQEAIARFTPVLVSNYISDDIEYEKVGCKFNYSKSDDFVRKFNFVRNANPYIQFPGLENYTLYSFEEVTNHHIKLYNSKLK